MSDELMERELAAVDDALATGDATAADPGERELRELALALRADAPAPDPAFAAGLRERMEAGFPPARDSARGRVAAGVGRLRRRVGGRDEAPATGARPRDGRWRRAFASPSGAGLGAVAAVLIAVVVAVAINDGGERATDGADGGGAAARERVPDTGATAQGDAGSTSSDEGAAESRLAVPDADIAPAPPTTPPAGRDDFAPGREQRIARAAALTLEAPGDELGRLADRVTAITDRHHGFVLRSSVTSGTDGDAGGTLELRVPATELRAAVRDLSALATVTSSTQSGDDVTGRFVSARDRLAAARAERVGLLKRLEDADTDVEAEALRRRLDLVAGEINGLRGQLRELRLKTNYAAVTVALEPADGDDGAAPPSSTEDALDDALGSLQGAVNVGLRVLGVALPLGVVALLGWLAARTLRRRRRESALA